MTQLNWIHISDVHIGAANFDRETVLTALLDDIRHRAAIDAVLSHINLLFFTGDLVFSGGQDEYKLAYDELIKPLADALGIDDLLGRVFIVPGNHDVDLNHRGFMSSATREKLNRGDARTDVQKLLSNDDELAMLLKSQAAYFKFFSDILTGLTLLPPCNHYVHKLDNNVAIVGLNSIL